MPLWVTFLFRFYVELVMNGQLSTIRHTFTQGQKPLDVLLNVKTTFNTNMVRSPFNTELNWQKASIHLLWLKDRLFDSLLSVLWFNQRCLSRLQIRCTGFWESLSFMYPPGFKVTFVIKMQRYLELECVSHNAEKNPQTLPSNAVQWCDLLFSVFHFLYLWMAAGVAYSAWWEVL